MGLSNLDWQSSLSLGIGLIFATLVLLTLVRATVDRQDDPAAPESTADGVAPSGSTTLFSRLAGTTLLAAVEEFHWCFLRGAIWELLLALPHPPNLPAYWTVWLARHRSRRRDHFAPADVDPATRPDHGARIDQRALFSTPTTFGSAGSYTPRLSLSWRPIYRITGQCSTVRDPFRPHKQARRRNLLRKLSPVCKVEEATTQAIQNSQSPA